nr:uncharacterized protein LOC128688909 isoform X1 [Cherax quadricarinatus]
MLSSLRKETLACCMWSVLVVCTQMMYVHSLFILPGHLNEIFQAIRVRTVPNHCFVSLSLCKLDCEECGTCYEKYIKCAFRGGLAPTVFTTSYTSVIQQTSEATLASSPSSQTDLMHSTMKSKSSDAIPLGQLPSSGAQDNAIHLHTGKTLLENYTLEVSTIHKMPDTSLDVFMATSSLVLDGPLLVPASTLGPAVNLLLPTSSIAPEDSLLLVASTNSPEETLLVLSSTNAPEFLPVPASSLSSDPLLVPASSFVSETPWFMPASPFGPEESLVLTSSLGPEEPSLMPASSSENPSLAISSSYVPEESSFIPVSSFRPRAPLAMSPSSLASSELLEMPTNSAVPSPSSVASNRLLEMPASSAAPPVPVNPLGPALHTLVPISFEESEGDSDYEYF